MNSDSNQFSKLLLPMAITIAASLAAGGLINISNTQIIPSSAPLDPPGFVSTLFSKWKATYGVHYNSPQEDSFR